MPFFADETDSRQVVFSLLRGVFVCYDPLPGQNFTGGSRLSEAAQAIRYVAEGHARGKVVVTV